MAGQIKEKSVCNGEDMFTMQEVRDERKLTRIRNLPVDQIVDFPDHPYRVRDDEDMAYLVESIRANGVARNLDNLMVIEKSGLGKLPIVDITELQMNLFLRSLTHYSESVIKKIYQQVKAAYRIAEDKNIVENNLMESTTIRRPRSSKKEKVVKEFT